MDPEMQAEAHVTEGKGHIALQRELIAKFQQDGVDTSEASAFLEQLLKTQQMHVADRDRLRRELGE